jgi:hypothetical protein
MAYTPVSLTMHNAEAALAQGMSAIVAGEAEVDLGALQGFDSAAIADCLRGSVLLERPARRFIFPACRRGLPASPRCTALTGYCHTHRKPNCPW